MHLDTLRCVEADLPQIFKLYPAVNSQ